MELNEKSVSKKQQRLFGMVRATQKGEMENPSPEVAKIASTVSKSDVKKMASTKHKGLPEKKEVKEAKYDNTKSPDYEKKKAALAKKHGGADKIKGHPQYEETKVVGRHRLAYEKYKTELQEDYICLLYTSPSPRD